MYKNKKILAIIPARGGSKGIPQKNIKPLNDKPLIAYSIDAALESKLIDRVIVSTEDRKIAQISKKYGAEIPFLRPKELAKDKSPAIDVILHSIDWLENQKQYFDIIVLLEPTSPLRQTEDIDKCIKILINTKRAKAIVSIAKLESCHPEFNVILNKKGFIKKLNGSTNFKALRRQDLSKVYFFDGTIYASYINTIKEKKTFYHNLTFGYIVPRYKSLEIDEPFDLILAEALIKAKKQGKI